ncbi:DUF4038 domain-containing protein [Cellulomonas marina]|uniref:apiosidase-like domain-containing protein n=1 Tax=Cellulomonas marina TaxID=988821 RepID=UPI0015879924|nr:DUF4038 domain-containing protein [Cellulomonas marina]
MALVALVAALLVVVLVVVVVLVRRDRGDEAPAAPAWPLAASEDGTGLVDADGRPVLHLADTVWLAAARLDQEGLRTLVETRAEQGLTALQVSVLPFVHLPGPAGFEDDPLANAYGDRPLEDGDLGRPLEVGGRTDDPTDGDYDYWDHVDHLVTLAAEHGLTVTLVPSWYGYRGEDWRGALGVDDARAYGAFLGERLGHHPNLLWLLGGDDDVRGDVDRVDPAVAGREEVRDARAATRAMAEAIRDAEAVPHLMSYHASRGTSSLVDLADEDWQTFVSAYSGTATAAAVAQVTGTGRPVVLTEAYYDGREDDPVLDRADLRAQAWGAVLGGAGFAAGHEGVWDLDPGHGPDSEEGGRWEDLLDAPSAGDLGVLATAVRDLLPLRPAAGLLAGGEDLGEDLDDDELEGDARPAPVTAAVSGDGRTALVHVPRGGEVDLQVRELPAALRPEDGRPAGVAWLDPATGGTTDAGRLDPADADGDCVVTLRAPEGAGSPDVVLVLTAG